MNSGAKGYFRWEKCHVKKLGSMKNLGMLKKKNSVVWKPSDHKGHRMACWELGLYVTVLPMGVIEEIFSTYWLLPLSTEYFGSRPKDGLETSETEGREPD